MLVLPDFEILRRQPKVPHVARTVLRREVPNDHGAVITYRVEQGRNGREWWIGASLDGLRMSNTLHTTARATADMWIRAIETGQVRVGSRAVRTAPAQLEREIAGVLTRWKRQ